MSMSPKRQPSFIVCDDCRDAPAPTQPKLFPGPVDGINFVQQHAGSFVFGGGTEPPSNGGAGDNASMSMDS